MLTKCPTMKVEKARYGHDPSVPFPRTNELLTSVTNAAHHFNEKGRIWNLHEPGVKASIKETLKIY
jgi:hypothetical protein